VQRAVNRIQPVRDDPRRDRRSRASGFKSLNVDLIYGLPKQSVSSFADTVERVLELRPDRNRPLQLRPPAPAVQAAAAHPRRGPAERRREALDHGRAIDLFNRRATSTSAWTTLRCPTTSSPAR